MAPRLLLSLLASALLLSAGCFGKGGGGEPEVLDNTSSAPTPQVNATLPDDRGESAGIKETNKTEEGVGGVDHKHDYWSGQEQVVIFDDLVFFSATPVFPDGEGSDPKAVGFIKLPCVPQEEGPCRPNLVYEGAERLSVEATTAYLTPQCEALNCSHPTVRQVPFTPHPNPPKLSLQHRTAASSEWTDRTDLAYKTPVDIQVAPKETDMPHSVLSLWFFRLTTDSLEPDLAVHVLITAHKGRDVVDWPGHPDFYSDKAERIVFDGSVSVHRSGADEAFLYGAGSTWNQPERLISHGTGKVDVFINVTKAESAIGAKPTSYILEYHDARILDDEDRFNERVWDLDNPPDGTFFHFEIDVSPEGMDGPYQPTSNWGVRLVAFFGDVRTPELPEVGVIGLGLCPGCFPYDLEYDMRIIARQGEAAPATM